MPGVEVRGQIDLLHVLNLVSDDAAGLDWSITDFWGVSDDPEADLSAVEALVESPAGYQLSFEELRTLASRLFQLNDGVFVGFRGEAPLRSDPDLRESAEIVIDMMDNAFWRVFAKEPAWLEPVTMWLVADGRPFTEDWRPLPASHD